MSQRTDALDALVTHAQQHGLYETTGGECWLCGGLGGLAVHNTATERFGKRLWVGHRLVSDTHPVVPCPSCHSTA